MQDFTVAAEQLIQNPAFKLIFDPPFAVGNTVPFVNLNELIQFAVLDGSQPRVPTWKVACECGMLEDLEAVVETFWKYEET